MAWTTYSFKIPLGPNLTPVDLKYSKSWPFWINYNSPLKGALYVKAILPDNENIYRWWPDAFDISFRHRDIVSFSKKYPQPRWYVKE